MNHKGVKCYIQLEKLPALSFTHKQPGQWAEKYCKQASVKLSMNENGHHSLSKIILLPLSKSFFSA